MVVFALMTEIFRNMNVNPIIAKPPGINASIAFLFKISVTVCL
jgi:hypothetical protein